MSLPKRMFDLFWAGLGLLLLWPAFLAIAVWIKLGDGGPVFFRQARVGRGGRTFLMVKFRTMSVGAERRGPLFTADGDRRVTAVGRWLRKFKLDELPQLLNVLAGEMSLVGPRPEVPRYAAHFPAEQRRVFDLTPGITHPGIIWNEEDLLAQAADPERLYISELIPEKNRRYLAYATQATAWTDLLVILGTLGRLLRGTHHRGDGGVAPERSGAPPSAPPLPPIALRRAAKRAIGQP